jgi:hypothetical protein
VGLIALASIKASPGVTTSALAFAATCPEQVDVLMAELDPAGGDIAARFGRPFDPGLVSLAAAARRPDGGLRVLDHCQAILGGVRTIVAPAASDRVEAALRLLNERDTWKQFANSETLVLADCGRLDPQSPALPVVQASTATIVICRPVLNELRHLHARLPALRRTARRLAVLLVGDGHYRAAEVRATLEIEVAGVLPTDRDAAAILRGEPGSQRALSRLPLMRTASIVSRDLIDTQAMNYQDADASLIGIEEAGEQPATAGLVESAP